MFGLGMGLSLSEGGSGGLVLPVTSGLVAHWDATMLLASSGDGTAVTTWTDLVSGIVATGSGPVYRATGAPNGKKPAVEFGSAHGASSSLAVASGLPSTGTVRTMVVATKPSSTTGGTIMSLGNSGSGAWLQHYNPAGTFFVAGDSGVNDTVPTSPANASTTYAHGLSTGSQIAVRINGSAQTVTGTAIGGSVFGPAANIGNRFAGTNQPWEGTMMELALYNRLLSTAEAQAIEAYYSAKWY